MKNAWLYDVVQNFNDSFYKDLLTSSHIISNRKPINLGTKDDPDVRAFYILEKDKLRYALEDDKIDQLPIIVSDYYDKNHYQDVLRIITRFQSARFKAERHYSFRELVDLLCPFEHSSQKDFTLYKIIVFASVITRLCCRVSSLPSFGKDSVAKVLGDLLGNVMVISNPTVAKIEYGLTNKLILLNEMANLTGEEKRSMEHFLLSTGDLSNVYEKRSRASVATTERYDISKLSLIIAYNNIECYPPGSKSFDDVFQKATRSRFLPLKLGGQITEKLHPIPNASVVAEENKDFYVKFIRSIMWYQQNWFKELTLKQYNTKEGRDYDLKDRWAANFDTIRYFIKLYAENEIEAQAFVSILYNRHRDYLMMSRNLSSLESHNLPPREDEDFKVIDVTEEKLEMSE